MRYGKVAILIMIAAAAEHRFVVLHDLVDGLRVLTGGRPGRGRTGRPTGRRGRGVICEGAWGADENHPEDQASRKDETLLHWDAPDWGAPGLSS